MGDAAIPYVAVIHEAALRMQFGGPSVARAQLHHLLAVSEPDNVTVLVLPFARGAFPGAGQTVVERYLTDTRDALRNLIADIKAGKADHLL